MNDEKTILKPENVINIMKKNEPEMRKEKSLSIGYRTIPVVDSKFLSCYENKEKVYDWFKESLNDSAFEAKLVDFAGYNIVLCIDKMEKVLKSKTSEVHSIRWQDSFKLVDIRFGVEPNIEVVSDANYFSHYTDIILDEIKTKYKTKIDYY